jgi:hypothetical protein
MTTETSIILTDFEKYKENYTFRNRAGLAPQTRLLAFCMDATGIKKLASREDMHELIVRMAILFKPMRMTETFFIKEYFFHFTVLGRNTFFILDDLQKHIGMELIDTQTEQLTRGEWLQEIGGIRWDRNVKEAMTTFIVLSRITWRMLSDDEDRQGYKWYYPRPGKLTMELNNARILADTITAEIDEIHFKKYQEHINNKTGINENRNEKTKIELPIIYGARRPANEIKNKPKNRPSSNTRDEEVPGFTIKEMKPNKKSEDGFIPWPFPKGSARRREYHRIDPSWN